MSLPIYGNVTVGTTATQILASNPARKGALILNNGNAILYVGMDANVTPTNGMTILPQASMNQTGIFDGYRSAIYGITSANTADVRYWDWPE